MNTYFYIYDNEDNKIEMQALASYKLKISEYTYIIYCDREHKNFYIGKYQGETITNLITNLTENEIKLGESILKELKV